jgi:hypothetical protein
LKGIREITVPQSLRRGPLCATLIGGVSANERYPNFTTVNPAGCPGPGFEQTRGTIRATVIDEIGNIVAGATLCAQPQAPTAMMIPQCTTDAKGSCTLSHLNLEKYFVFAGKSEDGYPEFAYSFFVPRGTKPMEAMLSEDHPLDEVIVHIGPKAGILTGTVADAATGKPLNANVEFRWISDPVNFLSGGGLTKASFRVLVPSDVALKMIVSLDGYENWVYGEEGGKRGKPLLLHPGQEEKLDIRLRPKHQ